MRCERQISTGRGGFTWIACHREAVEGEKYCAVHLAGERRREAFKQKNRNLHDQWSEISEVGREILAEIKLIAGEEFTDALVALMRVERRTGWKVLVEHEQERVEALSRILARINKEEE